MGADVGGVCLVGALEVVGVGWMEYFLSLGEMGGVGVVWGCLE